MGQYLIDANEFDACIAGLMPQLQERMERHQRGESLEDYPSITIVIGDLGSCFDAADGKTVKRLYSIVNLGRGLKVHLIVCGKSADVTKLYHGGDYFTTGLADNGMALLLGGSFREHGVFQSQLGYTETAAALGRKEGWFVREGTATRLRLADV